jgi:anthranilate phosphoribosyltransferase
MKVLKNEATPQQQDVVVANAAMALSCANQNLSTNEAVLLARETLQSGKAYQAFKRFIGQV